MLFKPPVGLEGVSSAICDFTSTSLFPVAVKTSLFTSWALSTVTCRYYLLSLRCHFIWAGVYYLLQLSALVFYLLFSHKYQRVSHLCLLFVFKLVKANCLFFLFQENRKQRWNENSKIFVWKKLLGRYSYAFDILLLFIFMVIYTEIDIILISIYHISH